MSIVRLIFVRLLQGILACIAVLFFAQTIFALARMFGV